VGQSYRYRRNAARFTVVRVSTTQGANICGHGGESYWHNVNGNRRQFPLCRDCHEDELRHEMRLNLDPGMKPNDE
jgi:hypothetical protein